MESTADPTPHRDTPTACHCGAPRTDWDHCPACGCEEWEAVCDHAHDPTEDTPYGTF